MRATDFLLACLAAGVFAACSGGSDTAGIADADGGPGSGETEEDGGVSRSERDAASPSDGPHSLGTIVLGESHRAGQSQSSPIVAVAFRPDAAADSACTETLAGCEITLTPQCKDGCTYGEVCAFDGACKPSCQKLPVCKTACKDDEACTLLDPTSGDAECRPVERFDAGPIAFTGTTIPITLFPPYEFSSTTNSAPFVGGAEIHAKAQGATGAGFQAFEDSFTATTYIQSSPALDHITRETVFGKGSLPVGWAPGNDSVVVTVSGGAGSATCAAADASGKLDVPRAVIDRVRGDGFGSSSLAIGLTRKRVETTKDKRVSGPSAQPVGWVTYTTSSTETASFQGCAASDTVCGDLCCSSTEECKAGKCVSTVCEKGPENTLARCSDGCSNDGDAYVDCNDYDCCKVRTDCPPTTACGKN